MLDDRVAHVYLVTSHTIRLQGKVQCGSINGRTTEVRKHKIYEEYYSKIAIKIKKSFDGYMPLIIGSHGLFMERLKNFLLESDLKKKLDI